jgi:uncharacterized protein YbjT (DUF2867 family)
MSTTTLVVGGTGTVGHNVAAGLRAAGADVVVATRDPARAQGGAEGVRRVRFDFTDGSSFGPALEGVDQVFLLAPPGYAAAHTLVAPFISALAASRVARVVLMTAAGVESSEEIPLRKVERLVEATGRRFVVLRPTWFSDNFHTFWLGGITAAGVIALPAADAKTPFIDARDIADAAVAALTSDRFDGRAFTLTGPTSLGYDEAAAILSRAADRAIRYVPIDDAPFRATLVSHGLPADYADLLVTLFQAARAGYLPAPNGAIEELTGHAPRTLEDYARDNARHWTQRA